MTVCGDRRQQGVHVDYWDHAAAYALLMEEMGGGCDD